MGGEIVDVTLEAPGTELTSPLRVDIFNGNLFLVPVPWDGMRRFRVAIAGPDGEGVPEARAPMG